MGDKIPKIVDEAKEQPLHSSDDTDAASGHIIEGKSKMPSQAGLPHKQTGDKMPHEHFHDKMTSKLGC